MNKISFEQLTFEVEKLYQNSMNIEENNKQALDDQCDVVVAFINACGWTEEEYWRNTYDNATIIKKMN